MSSYSCAGVPGSPLRRAGILPYPRLLRRCFMPGKSPPCRILTLVAGNCKSFLFREGKDLWPQERHKKTRGGKYPAQVAKTPAWGISGQMSGSSSAATHIEQSRIELPLHKKGTNQAAKNHPPKSRMGHGMGHERKTPETTDKQKRPETA